MKKLTILLAKSQIQIIKDIEINGTVKKLLFYQIEEINNISSSDNVLLLCPSVSKVIESITELL